ncbi:MAG: hypothetical protein H6632_13605 [Anaerolineales bacterium]|nr:hypothetical protein [Anaerolineales bacterium]
MVSLFKRWHRFRESDYGAQIFVWGVWLIMAASAVFVLVKSGRTVLLNEDWWLVPPLTGNEPDLLGWLWNQNSEHRIPVPRLILLALLKISEGDIRAGMAFNVTVLSAVAFLLILAARKIRGGQTRFADAFFPLILIHLGNAENLYWSWQLTQVVPSVLTCVILLVLVTDPLLTTPRYTLVSSVTLILLPLSGSHALIFAPAIALWFSFLAIRHWRGVKAQPRWISGFLIASALMSLLLTGLHFVTYHRPDWRPPDPTLPAAFETAIKFLALGLGPAVRDAWTLPIGIMVTVFGGATLMGILAFFRDPAPEKLRAFGLLLFFSNFILLALATGWSRATAIQTVYGVYPLRYVTMAVPGFLTAFFLWELYGPTRVKVIVLSGLMGVMGFLLPANTNQGLGWLYWFADKDVAFEQDLLSGTPATILAERYRDLLLHYREPDEIAGYMRMLRDADVGIFSKMVEDDPSFTAPLNPDITPTADRPNAEGLVSPDSSKLITYEIRYTIPPASKVYLVWGVNNWQLIPESLRPEWTEINGNVMYTAMPAEDDTFTVKIRVPVGTTVDYGFLIAEKRGFYNHIWPTSADWDWNGDQGYQIVALEDGITEVKPPLALSGYLFSINFGRQILLAMVIWGGITFVLGFRTPSDYFQQLLGQRILVPRIDNR